MESAVENLSSWAMNCCGLNINPNKADLVLFLSWYKIETFKLSRLRGRELPLSSELKYLSDSA